MIDIKKNSVLILGATGFLGKAVCRLLRERGAEPFETSLSRGVDLRDARQTRALFDQTMPEAVINCAAYVGGIQFGFEHPGEIFKNNLLMTINIQEACNQFQAKRLVNPIANCAYPARVSVFREEEFWDGPLDESVLVYGSVRKVSWVGAWAYHKQYRTDTVNLVLSNMYGPGDHFDPVRSHALGALIHKIIGAKERNQPKVEIWGTGKPVREWLYVDDGAEAMIRALSIEPYVGPVNVGVGKGISILELANLIKEIAGYQGELTLDTSKQDGAPHKTVDGSRGEVLLGWRPRTSLRRGIEKTVEFYLEQRRT
ncbi:MAG: NAD-dependent epimerase/dehydratase family protein [Candidatus Binatia bacterium]